MLTHSTHPSCLLIEQSDLDTEPSHPMLDGITGKLCEVLRWAREYLCRPHPDLGRKGSVCPYVQGSMERGTFYFGVHRGEMVTPAALDEALMVYRDWFQQLQPTDGPAVQFKAILVVLPDIPAKTANDFVDATQERLKPRYVANGLMIGEFHDGPPAKCGLWNPDFRPLRSPVPLLAIRNMVSSDFPFLAGDATFLSAYLRLFGSAVPATVRPQVVAAARTFGLTVPAQAEAPEAEVVPAADRDAR